MLPWLLTPLLAWSAIGLQLAGPAPLARALPQQLAENPATKNAGPENPTPKFIPLNKGKTGTDDDSVRPINPSLRPQTIAPLPKPQLPSKARSGTDDDSVRTLPPQATPPR